jgi:hypothetical protein
LDMLINVKPLVQKFVDALAGRSGELVQRHPGCRLFRPTQKNVWALSGMRCRSPSGRDRAVTLPIGSYRYRIGRLGAPYLAW